MVAIPSVCTSGSITCPAARSAKANVAPGYASPTASIERFSRKSLKAAPDSALGRAVDRLEPRIGGGYDIVVRSADGATDIVSARRVVLGGGALSTPLILQRSTGLWPSGKAPEIVGAGLMFHFSDIFAVKGMDVQSPAGVLKVLAFRDHYADGTMPLAECQSLGLPGFTMADFQVSGRGSHRAWPRRLAIAECGHRHDREHCGTEISVVRNCLPQASKIFPIWGTAWTSVGPGIVPGIDKVGRDVSRSSGTANACAAFSPADAGSLQAFFNALFQTLSGAPNLGHANGYLPNGALILRLRSALLTDRFGGTKTFLSLMRLHSHQALAINPALTVAANALRIAEGDYRQVP